jgi:GAF domain-containing protein/HAMP domain-containing protein
MQPFAERSTPTKSKGEFKGSLRVRLFLTLLLLAFIPLAAMGIAAYFRSSSLLREQAVTQMQTLLNGQMNTVALQLKTKAIRLERMTDRHDQASLWQQALHLNRRSTSFNSVRSQVLSLVQTVNSEETNLIFNQFLLVRTNGQVQIATRSEWEGISLAGTMIDSNLREGIATTLTLYDFAPLYPNQLVMLTIQPYRTESGSLLGATIGITEAQSLKQILDPLINLSPSANAYFVTVQEKTIEEMIGADPYTGDLYKLEPSNDQQSALKSAFLEMKGQNQESPPPKSLKFKTKDGHTVIAQAKWLPGMNAGIVLEIQEDVVIGQINSLIPFTLIIVFFAILGMAAVIGAVTISLLNPVIDLTNITRRFAEGDLSLRAEVKSSNEIGLLSHTFNQMAEELSGLTRSLEQKVEERAAQIRTAGEVAKGMTASSNLNELMNTTTRLVVERFGYYHAAIFMLDRAGKYAVIRAAFSPVAQELLDRSHSLEVGSPSVVGWASANNQPRVVSDTSGDPIHFKNNLLPSTRAEAGIPISTGDLVFGVLDVQSVEPNAFDAEAIIVLQTLANQIAAAIQNASLVESTQVNFQELERLYRSSRQIAQAQSEAEVLSIVNAAIKDAPYMTGIFRPRNNQLELELINNLSGPSVDTIPREIKLTLTESLRQLAGESIYDLSSSPTTNALTAIPIAMGLQSVAFLPIMRGDDLDALLMIGSRTVSLNRAILQPYTSLIDLTSITLEKIDADNATEDRLRELNALTSIGQVVSTATDASDLYTTLHKQVQNIIGDYSFTVALYDDKTNTIHIPYSYEDGRVLEIDPFPLGEGLTSVLIHSGKPLLLVEDTEKRAAAMGAKVNGRTARSWMGATMILNGEAIGALIVQDLDKEGTFTENHMKFLSALSSQVAGVIYNVRLLEDSRVRAVQLETAAEIAREVSRSFNVDELLSKAVNLIRERFNFYHASVFLLDLPGEYAVIREATGEAGAHFKRSGHKLGVGSKSIVGYVTGRGEMLVINDASKDPTYYANPLLPDTRSEAAIPLKVGERILGVLDVQSTQIFAFNEDNLRTLQILADQMAVAVANSELFSETQEHLSQHRLLHHITTTAASGTTLEEALTSAVNGLQVTLGGDRVSILLLDRERRELQIRAAVGYSDEVNQIRVPLGSGVTGWAASHRRPLRIDDTREDTRYIEVSSNTRSELAVPLLYRNELLGVLNVESEQLAAYSEGDEEMLGTLGGSLAAIIANARLLEQIRSQAERERQIYEVTSKIRRSTDMRTILETTGNELIKVVGARHARVSIKPVAAPQNGGNEKDEGTA